MSKPESYFEIAKRHWHWPSYHFGVITLGTGVIVGYRIENMGYGRFWTLAIVVATIFVTIFLLAMLYGWWVYRRELKSKGKAE